jgi:hypothetical protein
MLDRLARGGQSAITKKPLTSATLLVRFGVVRQRFLACSGKRFLPGSGKVRTPWGLNAKKAARRTAFFVSSSI